LYLVVVFVLTLVLLEDFNLLSRYPSQQPIKVDTLV
jgi:hypothetical protein